MSDYVAAIIVMIIRQILNLSWVAALWLSLKTFEYWLFNVPYQSSLLSWWWLASLGPLLILYVAVAYYTSDINTKSVKALKL